MTALSLVWCVTSVLVIGTWRSDISGLPTLMSLVLYSLSLLPLVPIMLTELRKVRRPATYTA